MISSDQKIKALEQDIAFLEAELEELDRRKEAAELFEDRITVSSCQNDIVEIQATVQRMKCDLATLEQKHSSATLIR